VLLDAQGKEIVRVKQFGFVRATPVFVPAPAVSAPAAPCDAIAGVVIDLPLDN
jgi:hypothetical protein